MIDDDDDGVDDDDYNAIDDKYTGDGGDSNLNCIWISISSSTGYLYSVGQYYHSLTAHTSLDYPPVFSHHHHGRSSSMHSFIHQSISMIRNIIQHRQTDRQS